ncbi:hypothetical protein [Bacillus halotolerans]|uniref:hypothetical protein n=1 Tax=Bacillus halotolerans TaxID=260554 RepID=UPI002DB97DBB|nr:hypothetical protein [Bacillus halotolerans]MEC1647617.1 hypothetical protein [Bacillus halotolerans]
MKVTFIGDIDTKLMVSKLDEIATSTIERIEKEQGVKINGYSLHGADLLAKVNVEGVDEPQLLTVDHHGMTEPFQWIVDMDKETHVNNQEESMFDQYTVAKAQGQEHELEEIESAYGDIILELEKSETYEGMERKVYSVINEDYKVVRVYQQGKLIQKIKLVPRGVVQ